MSEPNTALMELYGTDAYYLQKCGAISPAAYAALRALAGTAGFALARSDEARREQLLLEAQLMNQRFRRLQAERMRATVEGFGGPYDAAAAVKVSSALDPRLVKIAEDLGRRLAQEEMDKEALNIGQIAGGGKKLWGGLVGAVGRATQQVGRKVTGMGSTGRMMRAGAEVPQAKLPAVQRVGQAITGQGNVAIRRGQDLQQAGTAQVAKASVPKWERAVEGATPTAAPAAGAPYRTAAPTPTPTAPAVGAAPAAPAPQPAKKPLLGTGAKIGLGLLGAGAIGGTAYLGGKGVTSARDYMMVPSTMGGQTWGGYGPSPVHNVNQYGYVTPQF